MQSIANGSLRDVVQFEIALWWSVALLEPMHDAITAEIAFRFEN